MPRNTTSGQHFLKNKSAVEKIVSALELREGDNVIEIGSGHGELTLELLKHPIDLIAIEKDRELAEELKNKGLKLKIIEGDVLKELPKIIHKPSAISPDSRAIEDPRQSRDYKLVGNIPYYITGHLLRIISELEKKPLITVLTVQKEVAERIVAEPPKMNRLAAITQFWADPEIIAVLPPSDFDPSPEVESAIIKLEKKNYDAKIMKDYYKIVKILFQQPRKTILNNLSVASPFSKEEIINKLETLLLKGGERPQDLSIEILKKLTLIFQ